MSDGADGTETKYCQECGAEINKKAEICPECGVRVGRQQDIENEDSRDSMFYIGAVLGVIGVIFLPYFFFLVALPEAIIHMINGGSILDSLGKDASDNPAMKGTFLIFRWFGNFLLLVIVLGILFLFLVALT